MQESIEASVFLTQHKDLQSPISFQGLVLQYFFSG